MIKRFVSYLHTNCIISFCFRLYLVFHVCAVKFNIPENLENFFNFGGNYNARAGRAGPARGGRFRLQQAPQLLRPLGGAARRRARACLCLGCAHVRTYGSGTRGVGMSAGLSGSRSSSSPFGLWGPPKATAYGWRWLLGNHGVTGRFAAGSVRVRPIRRGQCWAQ